MVSRFQSCLASSRPGYRPDIDGLRAFAVLAVVLFHAFPGHFKGGFVGVDVFFVISGYLISGIIMNALCDGRFSFSDFYIRRVRRIFPALLAVMASVLAFGWFALLSDEYMALGKHVFGGATFSSNFILWTESGYWDTSSKTKILLHLWSLGIEEQFYIILPLLLWGCYKKKLRFAAVILALGFLSYSYNLHIRYIDKVADFYSPLARAWELFAGAALQAVLRENPVYWRQLFGHPLWNVCKYVSDVVNFLLRFAVRLVYLGELPQKSAMPAREIASLAGLALLVYSCVHFSESAGWPGSKATYPVAGTLLLIAAGQNTFINKWLFSNKLSVGIGLISYPLYLWHWPLISYAYIFHNGTLDASTRLVRVELVIVSFILAALTYFMVEKPVRFGKKACKAKAWCLLAAMVIVGCAGACVWQAKGIALRACLNQVPPVPEEIWRPFNVDAKNCHVFNGTHYMELPTENKSATLFIGDSNAMMYFARIKELSEVESKTINTTIWFTHEGRIPIPGMRYSEENDTRYAENALEFIKTKQDIRNVVIVAQWFMYFNGFGRNADKIFLGDISATGLLDRLSTYCAAFHATGKKVFLVLNIPYSLSFNYYDIVMRKLTSFPQIINLNLRGVDRKTMLYATAYGQYGTNDVPENRQFDTLRKALAAAGRKGGAEIIDPVEYLCKEECAKVDVKGEAIYMNSGHLNPNFVRYGVTYLDKTVRTE